jgi:phosphoenolpyruvate-protein kinase (PTS system EI component)
MLTIDKSRRSMFTTDSTKKIQEANYLCGEYTGNERLLRSIVRLGLADLSAPRIKLRTDAMRYILSDEFKSDALSLDLPYESILSEINSTINLKTMQKRAIIKKLISKIGV